MFFNCGLGAPGYVKVTSVMVRIGRPRCFTPSRAFGVGKLNSSLDKLKSKYAFACGNFSQNLVMLPL